MKKIISLLFLCTFFLSVAQQKELSIEDAVLAKYNGLSPKSLNNLHWINNNSNTFAYQQGNQLIFTDAKTMSLGYTVILFELQQVYRELKKIPAIIEISTEEFSFRNGNKIETFNFKQKKKSATIVFDENAENIEYNAKAKAVAYTVDNNLFIATPGFPKIEVTNYSDLNIVSGQAIHRREFGITKGTFWSPDGTHLAFYQKDENNVTDYPLVDVTTYPATLKNIKYPMAGQGSEKAKIGIFELKSNSTSYLDIDTSDEHYLTNLTWVPNNDEILLAEINRAQNHFSVNKYDIQSGKKVNKVFEEKNSKWTEPEFDALFFPGSSTNFLWMSERNGFMNLYEYHADGKFVKQLTNFKWVITKLVGFDQSGKNVIIEGTGTDPRESHVFKINTKNGEAIPLTSTSGTHTANLSPSGGFILDKFSSVSIPNDIQIIDIKKFKKTLLFRSKNPLEKHKLGVTEFVSLKGNDGNDLYGKITKPANFDASKKYPVLVYVYGGPHAQLVTNSWLGGSRLWMTAFATKENYIVFTLDNRGSANRGFAFESSIHRNVGEAEIEDQLTGIEYLKSLNYVDNDRIAINGWSYGGFMTTSLMLRNPGIFTTAVAGGPVIDWKFYEVMYGERYMDTPQENPKGYEKAKVANYIKNLDGKMLVIHGSVDPVVVPQHSMSLLQELVKQKVQIDFFTYPMHEHNVLGVDRAHLIEKMLDYIVENNQ